MYTRVPWRLFMLVFAFMALSWGMLSWMGPIKKSFGVESFYVGVYWNVECTVPVTHIDWGELTPGSTKDAVVFLRNEELNGSCYPNMWTASWTPSEGANYIALSWDCGGKTIDPDETLQATFTLKVSRSIRGVDDFDFTIIVFGADGILGDLNRDGVVNIYDVVMFGAAYGSTPGTPNWNQDADFNSDELVSIYDAVILCQNYLLSSG
jgi:hypothetical protein